MSRFKVLLIEDELSLQVPIERILRKYQISCDVTWCESGKKAIDLLKYQSFDLVISDYFLSDDITGLEVWKYVGEELQNQTRFLLMSGHSRHEIFQKLGDLGPDFLPKPFTSYDLVSAIEDVFELEKKVA